MTVTEKSSRKLITGSGWANPLTHNFELENSTHLKVYADDELLVLGVHYSVSGVLSPAGYSVTITTPADWDPEVWVLSVEPPIDQLADVSLGGAFGARFEDGLDFLARRVQRVWDDTTRSWKTPLTEAAGAGTLEVLPEDHFWIADEDGNMVDGGSAGDISNAQSYAERAEAAALLAETTSGGYTFVTKAHAESFRPAARPPYIRTVFLDTDATPESGAQYKYNGTTTGDITITSLTGLTSWGFDVAGNTVSATTFGLKAANTAAQNMTALKAAIARCPTGGTLLVPDLGAVTTIDTSGGLSGAALLSKKMRVVLNAHLKMSYAANEANPAYLFKVTAANVTFKGTGTLAGTGTYFLGGVSTATMPGLIYVNANNFRFSGIRIYQQPQTGFMLAVCYRAVIRDCEIQGGPTTFEMSYNPPLYTVINPSYAGSAHFGIVSSGGGDSTFRGVHFTVADDGGRTVNCIFQSGLYGTANGNKTLHCIAYYPYEKLLYGYGDNQTVAHNTVYGSGTASIDTHTEAYRLWGSDNLFYGNNAFGCRGAMQILDGARNIVYGNTFKDCRASGINIQHFTDAYVGGISGNRVFGNYIGRDGASVERRFAVRLQSNALMDVASSDIHDNTCIGWGSTADETEYAIDVAIMSPRVGTDIRVRGNTIESCGNGIRTDRCIAPSISGNAFNACTGIAAIHVNGGSRAEVAGNRGNNPGTWFLSMGTGGGATSGAMFRDNKCVGASNIEIRNHSYGVNNNDAEGNQWTADPLEVSVTLSTVSATTTITHGGVAPHATISLAPTSALFAARFAVDGLYTGPNSNDFNIVNQAGVLAAASTTGRAYIRQ